MSPKLAAGSTTNQPDDEDLDEAPPLTDAMMADAEHFEGDRFIKRGPGRPRQAQTKELVSMRLDPDLLHALRRSGPGWQSRVNGLLRHAVGLDTPAPPPT